MKKHTLHFFTALILCISMISSLTANAQESGHALKLPGGDGTISNVDISGLGLSTLPYTLEMWVRSDASQANNTGLIFNRPGNIGFQTTSGWQAPSQAFRYMAAGTGINTYSELTETPAVVVGEWHHVAVVMTDTSRTVYYDGVARGVDGAAGTYEKSTFTANDFSAGTTYLGWDSDGTNRAWIGAIDEVRIWDVAKEASQLDATIADATTEPGLVAYYNFNDQATTATDLTGNGNDGTITGGIYENLNLSADATLSTLTVDAGNLVPEFNADITNYIVMFPAATTSVTVGATTTDTNAGAAGTGVIDVSSGMAMSTITVTAENGTTKDYFIQFATATDNLMELWDGNGITGAGSKPNEVGWLNTSGAMPWVAANQSGGCRFRDYDVPGGQTGYTNESDESTVDTRQFMLRFDNGAYASSVYGFPVYLEACKSYTFSWDYVCGGSGTPPKNLTVGISTTPDASGRLSSKVFGTTSSTTIYRNGTYSFQPSTAGVYYLTINGESAWYGVNNLSIVENTEELLVVSESSFQFTDYDAERTFTVAGNVLTNDITLTAPAGITLDKMSISKEDAQCGVNVTATFDAVSNIEDIIVITSGILTDTIDVNAEGPLSIVEGENYFIKNEMSGLVMGENSSTFDVLNEANADSAGQVFQITGSYVPGEYFIKNSKTGYLSVDGSNAWDLVFKADTATSSEKYRFKFTKAETGTYYIHPISKPATYYIAPDATNVGSGIYNDKAMGEKAVWSFVSTKKTIVFVKKTSTDYDTTVIKAIEELGVYNVTVVAANVITEDLLPQFNAADVVIMGRSIGSSDIGAGAPIWDSITSPVLSMNMWGLRGLSGKAWWTTNPTADNIDTRADTTLKAEILVADPIFDAIPTLTFDWWNGMFSIFGADINMDNAGNGVVLAKTIDNRPLFMRWAAGVEFYPGAGHAPNGDRSYIGNGYDSNTNPINYFGFADEVKTIFFAELARMASGEATVIPEAKAPFVPLYTNKVNLIPDPEMTDVSLYGGWGFKAISREDSYSGPTSMKFDAITNSWNQGAAMDVAITWEANAIYRVHFMYKTMDGGSLGLLAKGTNDILLMPLPDTEGEWAEIDTMFETSDAPGAGFITINNADAGSSSKVAFIDNYEMYEFIKKKIVFVKSANNDFDTTVIQAIQENVEYNVTVVTANVITEDQLPVFNAADVVIMGRSIGSSDIGTASPVWDSITSPVLSMNMWGLRGLSGKAWWTTNATADNIELSLDTTLQAQITVNDPIFDAIPSLTFDWWNGMFSIFGSDVNMDNAGNGVVLAKTTDNRPLFMRWAAGVEFYPGAGHAPKGDRSYIGNGYDSNTNPINYFGFADQSKAIFFAELARMASGEATVIPEAKAPFIPLYTDKVNLIPNPEMTDVSVYAGWGNKAISREDSYSGASSMKFDGLANSWPTGAALDVKPTWEANSIYRVRFMYKTMDGGSLGLLAKGTNDIFLMALPDTEGQWAEIDTTFKTNDAPGSNFLSINNVNASSTAKVAFIDNWELYKIGVLSSDTTLSSLSLSVGDLVEVFDPATFAYTALVPTGTTSVTVTAVATDSEATVTLSETVVDVSAGTGTASIEVVAEDGTKGTYTVDITVKPSGLDKTSQANDARVYPTVSTANFTVAAKAGSLIEVYDITGALVTKVMATSNKTSISINKSGIHLFKVGSKVFRVMKID